MERPLIALDLETSGVDIAKDRIVEIGLIKIYPDSTQKEKVILINPGVLIPEEASNVHGITNHDVKDAPEFKKIAQSLYKSLQGCDILGYNHIKFDIPLLIEEFLRCGIYWSLEGVNVLDAYQIDQLINPRTLSGVYSRMMGEEMEGAHAALYDVRATIEIFNKQKDHLGTSNKEISDSLSSGRRPYRFCREFYEDDKGVLRFNMGKHRDKPISYDPRYLEWMLTADFSLHTKNIIKKLLDDIY